MFSCLTVSFSLCLSLNASALSFYLILNALAQSPFLSLYFYISLILSHHISLCLPLCLFPFVSYFVFLCFSMCFCRSPCLSLSLCRSLCLSLCSFLCLSPLSPFLYISISLTHPLTVSLSVSVSFLSACLFVPFCLSVFLFILHCLPLFLSYRSMERRKFFSSGVRVRSSRVSCFVYALKRRLQHEL